jgi:hypothetical protein
VPQTDSSLRVRQGTFTGSLSIRANALLTDLPILPASLQAVLADDWAKARDVCV